MSQSQNKRAGDPILCIETATEVCSVALGLGNETIALEEIASGFAHAAQITLLVDQCLDAMDMRLDQLSAIAVSSGPGSYTGLRVGISAAKGYCMALDIPLIALDTLQCLAQGAVSAYPDGNDLLICPMIDARRQEVYTAIYDPSLCEVREPSALVLSEDSFARELNEANFVVFTGNGAHKLEKILAHPKAKFINKSCSATDMIELANKKFHEKIYSDVRSCTPKYLKSPHITSPNKVL